MNSVRETNSQVLNFKKVYRREKEKNILISSHLNVNEQTFDGSEGIVNGEMEVEFPHEKQLVVQDDVHGPLLVSLDVGDELIDGNVELLHFAR